MDQSNAVASSDNSDAPEIVTSGSENAWDAAEAVFDQSEPQQQTEQQAPETTQVVPEIPDYLKLDDLRVPHKYKPFVEERIKKLATDFEGKQKAAVEAAQQELGQYQESVREAIRDYLKDPAKIADYIAEHGSQIGLDPAIAQKYRQQMQEQQQQPQQIQQPATLQDIAKKYAEPLITTQDPREFISILNQQNGEIVQVVQSQVMNQVGQLLKLYHEQYVAPDKQTLEQFKTKAEKDAATAEYNTKKSSWNQAADTLKGKYADFEKYKPAITKLIQEKKTLGVARDALNQAADDIEGRADFLEQCYLLVSRNDHVNAQKRPTQGGLPPTQKHIQTRNAGGGSWGSAWESTKHLYE